jgi:hypothetical protein
VYSSNFNFFASATTRLSPAACRVRAAVAMPATAPNNDTYRGFWSNFRTAERAVGSPAAARSRTACSCGSVLAGRMRAGSGPVGLLLARMVVMRASVFFMSWISFTVRPLACIGIPIDGAIGGRSEP